MPSIGPLELAVILVVALVVFGPKRLPELGKSMGKGIREFKGSLSLDDQGEVPAADSLPPTGGAAGRVAPRPTTTASAVGSIDRTRPEDAS